MCIREDGLINKLKKKKKSLNHITVKVIIYTELHLVNISFLRQKLYKTFQTMFNPHGVQQNVQKRSSIHINKGNIFHLALGAVNGLIVLGMLSEQAQ